MKFYFFIMMLHFLCGEERFFFLLPFFFLILSCGSPMISSYLFYLFQVGFLLSSCCFSSFCCSFCSFYCSCSCFLSFTSWSCFFFPSFPSSFTYLFLWHLQLNKPRRFDRSPSSRIRRSSISFHQQTTHLHVFTSSPLFSSVMNMIMWVIPLVKVRYSLHV